ncbi:MAG: hypothetical protein ACO3AV_11575 [Ilumatobacteraceae bacterium]
MTAPQRDSNAFDRRDLVRWLLALPLIAACRSSTDSGADVIDDLGLDDLEIDDLATAWGGRVPDDVLEPVRVLGRSVLEGDPGALAHAIDRLRAAEPSAAALADAVRLDAREGAVVTVEGALVPRTLAGLAAACTRI